MLSIKVVGEGVSSFPQGGQFGATLLNDLVGVNDVSVSFRFSVRHIRYA